MSAGKLRLRLGNMLVEVPIHRDEETTLAIVERVNERLRAIEEQSPVIDTQRFALLAAYAFAAETQDLEDEVAEMGEVFEEIDREVGEILGQLGMD